MMKDSSDKRVTLPEPEDYFSGYGTMSPPVPENILLFTRLSKETLQQNALENKSHHRFVLVFALQTAGHVHIDHLSLRILPQQALMIHPYQFHYFSHLEHSALCWLICTFELPHPEFLESLRSQVITLDKEALELRDALLREWVKISDSTQRDPLHEQLLQTRLLQLLIHLQSIEPCRVCIPAGTRSDNLLPFVNQRINQKLGRIGISDLAKACNYSESRFRALFRQEAGVTIGKYIQNYRLTRAIYLLKRTEHSIAEVGEMSGFESSEVFSRFFSKQTGKSPRKYRYTSTDENRRPMIKSDQP